MKSAAITNICGVKIRVGDVVCCHSIGGKHAHLKVREFIGKYFEYWSKGKVWWRIIDDVIGIDCMNGEIYEPTTVGDGKLIERSPMDIMGDE